jgi:hypothetical protein
MPGAAGTRGHDQDKGDHRVTRHAAHLARRLSPSGGSGELGFVNGLSSRQGDLAATLIEPLSTARHSGPPRAKWMTGTPPPASGPGNNPARPTTPGP